jgi:copper chaperone CopZ
MKEEEKNLAAAIEALEVTDAEDDTKYVSGVSETNGKISVLRKGTDTLKLNNYTIATASSDIANGDTINSAFGKIQKQIKDIYGNEEIAINFDTIKEIADWLAANDSNADKIIDDIATLKGNDTVSGSVANSIKNAIEGLDSSKSADTNKYISGITITNGKISNIA